MRSGSGGSWSRSAERETSRTNIHRARVASRRWIRGPARLVSTRGRRGARLARTCASSWATAAWAGSAGARAAAATASVAGAAGLARAGPARWRATSRRSEEEEEEALTEPRARGRARAASARPVAPRATGAVVPMQAIARASIRGRAWGAPIGVRGGEGGDRRTDRAGAETTLQLISSSVLATNLRRPGPRSERLRRGLRVTPTRARLPSPARLAPRWASTPRTSTGSATRTRSPRRGPRRARPRRRRVARAIRAARRPPPPPPPRRSARARRRAFARRRRPRASRRGRAAGTNARASPSPAAPASPPDDPGASDPDASDDDAAARDRRVHHGTLVVEGVVVDGKLVLLDRKSGAVYSSTRRAWDGSHLRVGAWVESPRVPRARGEAPARRHRRAAQTAPEEDEEEEGRGGTLGR